MAWVNWAEAFREGEQLEDIPSRVQRAEVSYWIWMGVSTLVWLAGFVTILTAARGQQAALFVGLFLAVEGAIMWGVIKVVTHVRLCMYRVLWEARQQARRELLSSEAADL